MNRGACVRTCPKLCTRFVMRPRRTSRGNFCATCGCREDRHTLIKPSSQPLKHSNSVNQDPLELPAKPQSNEIQPEASIHSSQRQIQTPIQVSLPEAFQSTPVNTLNEPPISPVGPLKSSKRIPKKSICKSSSQKKSVHFAPPVAMGLADTTFKPLNSNRSKSNGPDQPTCTNLHLPSPQNQVQQSPLPHCSKDFSISQASPKRKLDSFQEAQVNLTTFSQSKLGPFEDDPFGHVLFLSPPHKFTRVSPTKDDGLFCKNSVVQELTNAFSSREVSELGSPKDDGPNDSQQLDDNIGNDSQEFQDQQVVDSQPLTPTTQSDSVQEKNKRKIQKAKDDLSTKVSAQIREIIDDDSSPPPTNDEPVMRTMRLAMTKYCKTKGITGGPPKEPEGASHENQDEAIYSLPELSADLLKVLQGGDDNEVILRIDAIIDEVAHHIAPLPIVTRKDYMRFGSKMITKYPALGTSTLVQNYKNEKWEALGRTGDPDPGWPDTELDAMREDTHIQYQEALDRGENPEKPKKGQKPNLIGDQGQKVFVVKHPHSYSYFNRLLSARVRHLRSMQRDTKAVDSVLASCGEGTWADVQDLWPLRSTLPADYTTSESGLAIKMMAEMAKESCDSDFVLDAFSRTFKMRTSLLKTSLGVSAVFENFAVFKSSSYVKLEAQLMLGKEKFGLFLKNASIFFQAIQKLKPHGPGWMAFIEAMRTVVKDPRELREVYCGGDTLGGTAEKFPHLIIIKRPDNTVEQVIVRIDTNVILGCQDWKEGVEVLVLSYLVFNFNIRKHSNIIKMLARAFFGLKKEKKLTTSCANKLLATLSII